jgi:hypothetical protein
VIDNQAGWTGFGYGYHSDDGLLHGIGNMGVAFGRTFGPGDTVGCFMQQALPGSHREYELAFSTNGAELNVGNFKDPRITGGDLLRFYPAIGIDTFHPLHVNFGQTEFVLDGNGKLPI